MVYQSQGYLPHFCHFELKSNFFMKNRRALGHHAFPCYENFHYFFVTVVVTHRSVARLAAQQLIIPPSDT